ncbi:hypothetical protein [Streptomyces subrutilus]|uniref:hypothetical protein n=1 Tax=Streptomyces subrutilus TaxID=36818 RepID=UPI003406E10A
MTRRPSNSYRPSVSRPGAGGLRFGMTAVCVIRDSDPGLNSGKAKSLYPLLVTFADVGSRDTDKGYPYRAALADSLDCTKQTVDNATKYLEHEIGLIRVTRRKVDGRPDENDANRYEVFDAWLIHGFEPPGDTPPQLVARYGPTLSGFDIDGWVAEHAPAFDLAAWRATYEGRLLAQEAKREEQRRKDRERRKPKKKGGGGTSSATLEAEGTEGGSGISSATPGGISSATRGGTDSARSTTLAPDATDENNGVPDAVGQSAGGYARAGTRQSAADENAGAAGGSAASDKALPPQRTKSPRPATVKTRPRQEPRGFEDVRAAIPETVARPGTRLFPGLHRALVDLLTGAPGVNSRTPEQVIAKINRRWYGEQAATRAGADYRGCDRCTPSGCKASRDDCDRIINRSSWLAAALLVQDCPDPSCEDGIMLDGTGECHACIKRRDDRRREEEAAAEVAARLTMRNPPPQDGQARAAAMATMDGWSQAAHTEELRFRLLLTARGIFGAMLDHQVAKHMTAWQDRNPAPAGPAAPRSVPAEEEPAEEEPGWDGPAEEEPAEEAASWEVARRPSAEYLAAKTQREEARARREAAKLAALVSR